MEWYSLPLNQVFERLQTSEKGLSESEVKKRLKLYGKNEIQKREKLKNLKIKNLLFLWTGKKDCWN